MPLETGGLPARAPGAGSCSSSSWGLAQNRVGKLVTVLTPASGVGAIWIPLRRGPRSPKVRPRELIRWAHPGVTGHVPRTWCRGPGQHSAAPHCLGEQGAQVQLRPGPPGRGGGVVGSAPWPCAPSSDPSDDPPHTHTPKSPLFQMGLPKRVPWWHGGTSSWGQG